MSDVSPYDRSAQIYDAIHHFIDFPSMVAHLRKLIDEHEPRPRSVLDVACGTGRHLELLGDEFDRAGVDLSQSMLDVAAERCRGVPFVAQDMVALELGRRFDLVMCLFSSVAFVRTVERLHQAIAAMARHLSPSGLLLVEPWFTPETYREGHLAANHTDTDDLKVTWMYLQERQGNLSHFTAHYLVGTKEGINHFTETYVMGLFTDEQYRSAFRAATLDVEFQPDGLYGRGVYRGTPRT